MSEVATGEASLELGPADEGSSTSERVYDPLWHKAKLLLDHLEDENLLERELQKARFGQFVLVKGTLLVLDLAMLKQAWDKPAIKQLMQSKEQELEDQKNANLNRHQRRQEKSSPTKQPSQSKATSDIMSFLPHSVQAHILGGGSHVWCILDEEYLVGRTSDLLLKHGSHVPGEWGLLAIMDAFPDFLPADSEEAIARQAKVVSAIQSLAATPIGILAAQLAPVVRDLLGRPRPAFGVTPLLIFRDVSERLPSEAGSTQE